MLVSSRVPELSFHPPRGRKILLRAPRFQNSKPHGRLPGQHGSASACNGSHARTPSTSFCRAKRGRGFSNDRTNALKETAFPRFLPAPLRQQKKYSRGYSSPQQKTPGENPLGDSKGTGSKAPFRVHALRQEAAGELPRWGTPVGGQAGSPQGFDGRYFYCEAIRVLDFHWRHARNHGERIAS